MPSAKAAWRAALAPYFAEFGVDPNLIPQARANAVQSRGRRRAEEFRPAVVSFHFGLPSAELLARVRGWGAKVLSLGDHRGRSALAGGARRRCDHRAGLSRRAAIAASFSVDGSRHSARHVRAVPQIVQAVKVPVIAAGGIADAKGVAAAMALGAAGVQVGTAYLLCPEATTKRRASCRAEERCRAAHRAHEFLHRPSGARHRQPADPRVGPDQSRRARVSAGVRRHRSVAREGGKPGQR